MGPLGQSIIKRCCQFLAACAIAQAPAGWAVQVINQASAALALTNGTLLEVKSETVVVSVNDPPPTLNFFDPKFSRVLHETAIGSPLYLQARALGCNQNPASVETKTLILSSKLTGDLERFPAIETGTNSGIFRVLSPVPTVAETPGRPGNGQMEILPDDTLTATLEGCDGSTALAVVTVQAPNRVFDSKSGAAVSGVKITLLDANTGEPALVYLADGRTPAPSTVESDASGHFQFGCVPNGVYQLRLEAPVGYQAPSAIPAQDLPQGFRVDPAGSYGQDFNITAFNPTVSLDIPVDKVTPANSRIFLRKSANRTEAEIGDWVDYTLEVKNPGTAPLTNVRIQDNLPAAFAYVRGSARVDGQGSQEPRGAAGPRLEFALGTIEPGKSQTLHYRVEVRPGALQGDGINRALALAEGGLVSNEAWVKVALQPGIFTEKGTIIGKVFIDENGNRIQDDGEVGVPGVRIYIEDGTFAVTDSEGKYSFYGLRPTTHVLKLDRITLPKGAKLEVIDNDNAGDPGTRFAALKNYGLLKGNFALKSPSPEVRQEVERRRRQGDPAVAEISRNLDANMTPDGLVSKPADPKAGLASGLVNAGTNQTSSAQSATNFPATNAPAKSPNFTSLLPEGTLGPQNSDLPKIQSSFQPGLNLEQSLTNLDNTLAFLDLKTGDTLASPQTTVRLKGPNGGKIVLKANGAEVPNRQRGKHVEIASRQVQAAEYIGVQLKPGTNSLEIAFTDPFGNVRATQAIAVVAPDRLARLQIELPKEEQPADGLTPAWITVRLQDAQGVPVSARTPITLEASNGRWDVTDLNPAEGGTQVFIENGVGRFKLLPPQEPGDCVIRVSSGLLQDQKTLAFLPDLRPMLAVGVVEGTLHVSDLKNGVLLPARSNDGFEEELRNWAASSGNVDAGARGAFYLKGKIKGQYLLTAAYDSNKPKDERLFRDIQPDEFYPVYGDGGLRGYDAQSTGRLYVRIDKKRCYLLYGDLTTGTTSEARGLGNYNRSLTGVREHYEKDRVSANIWASQDSTRQVIEELPANGTSGPYFFNVKNAVANSEKVEILTRDRNQTSVILQSIPMTRFEDYEFEPFTGRILFKGPVASLDPNLNPISIRVTYEVQQDGDAFWVYGADAQVKVTDWWEVGGSGVRDENPLGNYSLYSANSTVKVAKNTYAIAEVAQSDDAFSGTGDAGRVEVRHRDERTDARIYAGQTERNFTNNSSIMMPGRTEAGFKVTEKVAPTVSVVSQGILTEDLSNHGERKGVTASVVKTLGPYSVEVGARHSEETANPASSSSVGTTPNEVNSLRTKVTAPVPGLARASAYGEYENDVLEPDNRLVAMGADYRYNPKTRFYARHEFIDSLGGPFELNSFQQRNTTVAGFETEYMKDGQSFNEYRMRDSINGRDAEAAMGLRNLWRISDGLKANTSLERVTPITAAGEANEATAATVGMEYTADPLSKITGRLEGRDSQANDTFLNTLGYARKLSRDWTFLGKTIYMLTLSKQDTVGDHTQARGQLGLAYRQTKTDRWNGLLKYEYRYEDDEAQLKNPLERHVNLFIGDLNYQPVADWTLSGHYAFKVANESGLSGSRLSFAQVIGGRVTYDLTKRWDIGFGAYTLADAQFQTLQFAYGPEVGFVLHRNVRVGLGFNLSGFRDRDLDENYTRPGVYLNMRIKFDELLFGKHKEDE